MSSPPLRKIKQETLEMNLPLRDPPKIRQEPQEMRFTEINLAPAVTSTTWNGRKVSSNISCGDVCLIISVLILSFLFLGPIVSQFLENNFAPTPCPPGLSNSNCWMKNCCAWADRQR